MQLILPVNFHIMKHLLIPLLFLAGVAILSAQSMERQVVGIGGGYVQTAAGSLHWTAGEVAVSARTGGGIYWGEGFQQLWLAPAVATHAPDAIQAISIAVYPNPAGDYLRVESDTPLQVQLFDLAGRPLSGLLSLNGSLQLDLSALPAGLFLLRAFEDNGRLAGVAKVQHIR
ncbi:MAG: hypothetical protein EPGJADBJ_03523 [Saprospiraceae bacterium]|nr:hypothetical protein [Saprospiraceae bacterium]